jgi:hypothetical protein
VALSADVIGAVLGSVTAVTDTLTAGNGEANRIYTCHVRALTAAVA